MHDSMVTARMPHAKKEAGNRILDKLGITASQFINDMYDYLIAHGTSPLEEQRTSTSSVDPAKLAEAMQFINKLVLPEDSRLRGMTADEVKRDRLVSRGLMEA